MKPKHTRIIDGIPCMTVAEHEAIVASLKRQWVGLTDEERRQIALDDPIDWVAAIEAKLKEKNEKT